MGSSSKKDKKSDKTLKNSKKNISNQSKPKWVIKLKNVSKKKKNVKKAVNKVTKNDKDSDIKNSFVTIEKVNKSYKQTYTPEDVRNALIAMDAGLPLKKASDTYGIPRSTLSRKRTEPIKYSVEPIKRPKYTKSSQSGSTTVFNEKEEQQIVDWICYRAERGFTVKKNDILDSLQPYVVSLNRENPFANNRPGKHWFEGFVRRHPEVVTKIEQYMALYGGEVTEENLRNRFQEIKRNLESKNLFDIESSRIFHCCECNIEFNPYTTIENKTKATSKNEIQNVKILFMYSADGNRGPPMIVYPHTRENISKKVFEQWPNDWGVGVSENSSMTTDNFYKYITNIFYPWLLKNNANLPVVLYVKENSPNITLPLVAFCRNKIELISVYSNPTHIMEPLDNSVIDKFQDVWEESVTRWKNQNNIERLKKEQFPDVFKTALDSFKKEKEAVQNGFAVTGLIPHNPDILDYQNFKQKKKKNEFNFHNSLIKYETEESELMESKEYSKEEGLRFVEENLLLEQLELFKKAESNNEWIGPVELKGLYDFWLKIKSSVSDSS